MSDYTAQTFFNECMQLKKHGYNLADMPLFIVAQEGEIRLKITSARHRDNGGAIDFSVDESTVFHSKLSRAGDYHDRS
jgi:hypothetical protein